MVHISVYKTKLQAFVFQHGHRRVPDVVLACPGLRGWCLTNSISFFLDLTPQNFRLYHQFPQKNCVDACPIPSRTLWCAYSLGEFLIPVKTSECKVLWSPNQHTCSKNHHFLSSIQKIFPSNSPNVQSLTHCLLTLDPDLPHSHEGHDLSPHPCLNSIS